MWNHKNIILRVYFNMAYILLQMIFLDKLKFWAMSNVFNKLFKSLKNVIYLREREKERET